MATTMASAAPKPNKPLAGGRYVHFKTGGEYRIDAILPIKLGDAWEPDGLIVYQSVRTRQRYSRLTADFMQKFYYGFPDKQNCDPLKPDQYEQNLLQHGIVR